VTTKNPDVTTKNPDVTTKNPDVTTKSPDVTTKNPDVTTKNPDVTTKNPDVTTKNPDVTTKNPDVTTKNPDVTTKNPDVTTKNPDVTTKNPDATKKPTAKQIALTIYDDLVEFSQFQQKKEQEDGNFKDGILDTEENFLYHSLLVHIRNLWNKDSVMTEFSKKFSEFCHWQLVDIRSSGNNFNYGESLFGNVKAHGLHNSGIVGNFPRNFTTGKKGLSALWSTMWSSFWTQSSSTQSHNITPKSKSPRELMISTPEGLKFAKTEAEAVFKPKKIIALICELSSFLEWIESLKEIESSGGNTIGNDHKFAANSNDDSSNTSNTTSDEKNEDTRSDALPSECTTSSGLHQLAPQGSPSPVESTPAREVDSSSSSCMAASSSSVAESRPESPANSSSSQPSQPESVVFFSSSSPCESSLPGASSSSSQCESVPSSSSQCEPAPSSSSSEHCESAPGASSPAQCEPAPSSSSQCHDSAECPAATASISKKKAKKQKSGNKRKQMSMTKKKSEKLKERQKMKEKLKKVFEMYAKKAVEVKKFVSKVVTEVNRNILKSNKKSSDKDSQKSDTHKGTQKVSFSHSVLSGRKFTLPTLHRILDLDGVEFVSDERELNRNDTVASSPLAPAYRAPAYRAPASSSVVSSTTFKSPSNDADKSSTESTPRRPSLSRWPSLSDIVFQSSTPSNDADKSTIRDSSTPRRPSLSRRPSFSELSGEFLAPLSVLYKDGHIERHYADQNETTLSNSKFEEDKTAEERLDFQRKTDRVNNSSPERRQGSVEKRSTKDTQRTQTKSTLMKKASQAVLDVTALFQNLFPLDGSGQIIADPLDSELSLFSDFSGESVSDKKQKQKEKQKLFEKEKQQIFERRIWKKLETVSKSFSVVVSQKETSLKETSFRSETGGHSFRSNSFRSNSVRSTNSMRFESPTLLRSPSSCDNGDKMKKNSYWELVKNFKKNYIERIPLSGTIIYPKIRGLNFGYRVKSGLGTALEKAKASCFKETQREGAKPIDYIASWETHERNFDNFEIFGKDLNTVCREEFSKNQTPLTNSLCKQSSEKTSDSTNEKLAQKCSLKTQPLRGPPPQSYYSKPIIFIESSVNFDEERDKREALKNKTRQIAKKILENFERHSYSQAQGEYSCVFDNQCQPEKVEKQLTKQSCKSNQKNNKNRKSNGSIFEKESHVTEWTDYFRLGQSEESQNLSWAQNLSWCDHNISSAQPNLRRKKTNLQEFYASYFPQYLQEFWATKTSESELLADQIFGASRWVSVNVVVENKASESHQGLFSSSSQGFPSSSQGLFSSSSQGNFGVGQEYDDGKYESDATELSSSASSDSQPDSSDSENYNTALGRNRNYRKDTEINSSNRRRKKEKIEIKTTRSKELGLLFDGTKISNKKQQKQVRTEFLNRLTKWQRNKVRADYSKKGVELLKFVEDLVKHLPTEITHSKQATQVPTENISSQELYSHNLGNNSVGSNNGGQIGRQIQYSYGNHHDLDYIDYRTEWPKYSAVINFEKESFLLDDIYPTQKVSFPRESVLFFPSDLSQNIFPVVTKSPPQNGGFFQKGSSSKKDGKRKLVDSESKFSIGECSASSPIIGECSAAATARKLTASASATARKKTAQHQQEKCFVSFLSGIPFGRLSFDSQFGDQFGDQFASLERHRQCLPGQKTFGFFPLPSLSQQIVSQQITSLKPRAIYVNGGKDNDKKKEEKKHEQVGGNKGLDYLEKVVMTFGGMENF